MDSTRTSESINEFTPEDIEQIKSFFDNGGTIEDLQEVYTSTQLAALIKIIEPLLPKTVTRYTQIVEEYQQCIEKASFDLDSLEMLRNQLNIQIDILRAMPNTNEDSQIRETALLKIDELYKAYLVNFSDYFLVDRDSIKKNLFNVFPNSAYTEQEINKAYRRLAKFFDTNRNQAFSIHEFFKLLSEEKSKLIKHVNCLKDVNAVIARADDFFKKLLSADNEEQTLKYASEAYKFYKSACVILDHNAGYEDFSRKAELRKKIAEVLYRKQDYLGAQIYIIASTKFIIDNFENINNGVKLIREMQQLLADIRNNITADKPQVNNFQVSKTEIPSTPPAVNVSTDETSTNQSLVLSPVQQACEVLEEISSINKNTLAVVRSKINESISWNTVIHSVIPERAHIKSNLTEADLRHYNSLAKRKMYLANALNTGASSVGLVNTILQAAEAYSAYSSRVVTVTQGVEITNEIVKTVVYRREYSWWSGWQDILVHTSNDIKPSSVVQLPASSETTAASWFSGSKLLGGLSLALTAYTTYKAVTGIYSDVQRLKSHGKKALKLSKNIEQVINYHSKCEFRKVIDILAEDIGDNEKIISFTPEKKAKFINTDDVIDKLLMYGFRPDSIAYILFVVADCLMSNKLGEIEAMPSDLNHEARKILESILDDEKLVKKARELEEESVSFIASSRVSKFFKSYWSGANEEIYKQIIEKSPTSSLNLIKMIAKVNLTLLLLVYPEEQAIVQVQKYIDSIEKEIGLLPLEMQDRFEKLKEFMAIFGYDKFKEDSVNNENSCQAALQKISLGEAYEKQRLHLKRVRNIHLVKIPSKSLHYCEVIPAAADGNCGFSAIAGSLIRQGKELPVSRTEFVNAIEKIDKERKDEAAWNELLKELYIDAKTDNFINWSKKFNSSGYWVNEIHLKIMSKLYNLHFYIYKLPSVDELAPNEKTDVFVPYPADTYEVGCGLNTPHAYVNLIHIPLQPFDDAENSALIHFDGLHIYSDEEALKLVTVQIHKATSDIEINKLKRQRGVIYFNKGISEKKSFRTYDALRCFKYATEDFITIMESDNYSHEINDYFYLVKAFIYLSKYDEAQKLLSSIKQEDRSKKLAEFYYLTGVIYFKLKNYQLAKVNFTLAKKAGYEQKSIDKKIAAATHMIEFKEKSEKIPLFDLHKEYQKHYAPSLACNKKTKNQPYRILSIDGGGIRGIIPAVWLSELERRTHAPIAETFDLLAGTSTGGILAAGLAVDKPFSHLGHYSADELLSLYLTKASEIFSPPEGIFGYIKKYKYSYGSEGITRVLKEYFADKKLLDCSNDLLITSVETSDLYKTFTFSKNAAASYTDKNYSLVDVVRATSAAPTYFPPHKFGDRCFIDGGVRTNNPTLLAYEYAKNSVKTDKDIEVVSLGTGEYVPDPINPNIYNGLIFWAQKVPEIAMSGQEYNTHLQMQKYFDKTPNRYFRLQAHLDEVIKLDEQAPSKLRNLVEIAHESLEEAYADDGNHLNKLIESLSK